MSGNEEIKAILIRIETDTSNLVERVARLEAEVSHLTGNIVVPNTPERPKMKTDTVWTFGPSIKYNHV